MQYGFNSGVTQFEDCSGIGRPASLRCGAIEITGGIQRYTSQGIRSVGAAREAVEGG
jgi:hypothetical protein